MIVKFTKIFIFCLATEIFIPARSSDALTQKPAALTLLCPQYRILQRVRTIGLQRPSKKNILQTQRSLCQVGQVPLSKETRYQVVQWHRSLRSSLLSCTMQRVSVHRIYASLVSNFTIFCGARWRMLGVGGVIQRRYRNRLLGRFRRRCPHRDGDAAAAGLATTFQVNSIFITASLAYSSFHTQSRGKCRGSHLD